MSNPGPTGNELPPANTADLERAIREPFADPSVPEGARVSYNHTEADQAFNDRQDPEEFAQQLAREDNIVGLARHEPSTLSGPQYPAESVRTVTMPATDADKDAASHTGDQAAWDAFAEQSEDLPAEPRRRRVAGYIRRAFRAFRG